MEFLQKGCLLMQIQTESCSRKILKNFNFEIKNAINGYFRCILKLEFAKTRQLSCAKSTLSNLSKYKISCKNKKTLNLGPKTCYLGVFGLRF